MERFFDTSAVINVLKNAPKGSLERFGDLIKELEESEEHLH